MAVNKSTAIPTLSVSNTREIKVPWTHWFLYGDTGSGKTTAAATFPRPLFLVPKNESSMTTLSGRDYPYILVTDRSSTFSPARPGSEAEGGMDAVLTVLENALDQSIRKNDELLFPYQTVVIESLTHYCDLVQDELTEGSNLPMDVQRYGKLSAHLRNIQVRLRNMDVHCVFTSLATTNDNNEGMPAIPGQQAKKLPASCDVIGYMEVTDYGPNKPQKHTLHLRQRKQFFARTRFNRLPAQIENFSFNAYKHLLVSETAHAAVADEPTTEEKQGD